LGSIIFDFILKKAHSLKVDSKTGDLIQLAQKGHFDVIAHGANCFCTFGAGIAKAIKKAFPEAYEADLATKKGDYSKLGNLSLATVERGKNKFIVANLYTQFFYGTPKHPKDTKAIRYKAIENSLKALKKQVPYDASIGLPKIGAGLAGGDWEIIRKIILSTIPNATIISLPLSPKISDRNVDI
jgi:O-acetyl-ADP-ribose deacetylase (regulator of RNase III)